MPVFPVQLYFSDRSSNTIYSRIASTRTIIDIKLLHLCDGVHPEIGQPNIRVHLHIRLGANDIGAQKPQYIQNCVQLDVEQDCLPIEHPLNFSQMVNIEYSFKLCNNFSPIWTRALYLCSNLWCIPLKRKI